MLSIMSTTGLRRSMHRSGALAPLFTALRNLSTTPPKGLTASQLESFDRDGFLVVPGFATKQEAVDLREQAQHYLKAFEPEKHKSVFSTTSQVADDYFLNSGTNVSCFFEEGAHNDDGTLKHPVEKSINKLGHALHEVDPVFRAFSLSPKVAGVLKSIGFEDPAVCQSMFIFKQPTIGGVVVPHQDSTFLYTEPKLSVRGMWWALEDATQENGCLWAVPGSHKSGCPKKMKLKADSKGIEFENEKHVYDTEGAVPVEVAAGDMVLLHGEVVHFSSHNHSDISRHAYAIHIVEMGRGLTWSRENWLQRSASFPRVYAEYAA